jgi:predicted ATPase/DNA-binding SARP family transcriptional activator
LALAFQFLGPPQLILENEPVNINRRSIVALLAYLAVNDDGQARRTYTRESLSALLWPDYNQVKAFTNLRHTLWEIQKAFGPGLLIADRETIGLQADANVWVDVQRFESLLSESQTQSDVSLRIPLLTESVKLYRHHFLTGFNLKNSPTFDAWSLTKADELHHKLTQVLTLLTEDYCLLGDVESAVQYARRLVTLDPLNESAHRLLMQIYSQVGQHNAAMKQYQSFEQTLRKEMGLDPQPETRALYKQIRKGEIKQIPAGIQKESKSPRNNLPHRLTTFIGRQQEQTEILRLIAENRLVTLVGAGGVGKSRLALQVGEKSLSNFPDGVWLVELAPTSDPSFLPQVILNTLGLIEQAAHSPLDILTDFLHTKKVMLILDNCDHLILASAQLSEMLLQSCINLHILATSREALSIDGETVYLVPTLSTPNSLEARLESLLDYQAVQLFLERAQTALAGFRLTAENALAIVQVCYRLDGIPLAIELAAARVKLLRVDEIAARLDDRFHLLIGGSRTALPRHQTLQAMIDWGYDLLSEPERALVRQLSVFAGGWTLEAAESVCVDVGQDAVLNSSKDAILSHHTLDLLTSLVNKSLILPDRKQGQETRYQMLETIRQHAHDKLREAGEGEVLQQRHLAYFVELAERAEPNLRAFDMVMWLDRLDEEHDNIRTALAWAKDGDVESQLRLAGALLWFWHIRGYKNEGCQWLEQGLSTYALGRGEGPLLPTRALIRAKALFTVGFLKLMSGEWDRGAALSEESLRLFRELGTAGRRGMAYALWNMSVVADTKQDFPLQQALLEEGLAVFKDLGDKFGTAQCLMGLSYVAMHNSDYKQAKIFIEGHLALREEIGDKDGVAIALDDLGFLAASQGNYEQARIHYEASLSLFRELRNKWAMSWVLSDVGRTAIAQGDFEQATKILEEARSYHQDLGDRSRSATTLIRLGSIARSQGDYERANKLHEEGLALFREFAEKVNIAYALRNVGLTAFAQGDDRQAESRFEEALIICQEIGEKFEAALSLYGFGRVEQARCNYTSARARYVEGITITRDQAIVAQHLEGFAVLAVAQKHLERAARLFSRSQVLHAPFRFEMSAKERAEHDEAIATARSVLGEDAFSAAWEEGKKMTLDEAIRYAIEENDH